MKTIIAIISTIMLVACSTTPDIPPIMVNNTVSFTGEYTWSPDVRPQPLSQPRAPFGMPGEAVISFIVEVDGSTSQIQIAKATSAPFGELARACVSRWVFRPGSKGGKPIRVATNVPIFCDE
jgi:hypothetical protein